MNKYSREKNNISKYRKFGITYNLSDKIIIFDTYFGLCNQIYDIHHGIKYCVENNIKFTFRYANFRKDDLLTYYNVNFEDLFDISLFKNINLYVDLHTFDLNKTNTYNLDTNIIATKLLKHNIKYIQTIKEPYIVIKGMFQLINNKEINTDILNIIQPAPKIMEIYKNICNKLKLDKPYNFLHYRYEHDFTSLHNISNTASLDIILNKIKFKNNEDNIYLASSNIKNILKNNNLIYKNESELKELNFEERAFIDFMIGKNSREIYGHPKSSFSWILNKLKGTENYY
jgi:hypothetical protein